MNREALQDEQASPAGISRTSSCYSELLLVLA